MAPSFDLIQSDLFTLYKVSRLRRVWVPGNRARYPMSFDFDA